MSRFLKLSLIFVSAVLLDSCSGCGRINPQIPSNTPDIDTVGKNLIDYNRLCIEDEKREIEAYIDSVQKADSINFELDEDGFYIHYTTKSNGPGTIVAGDEVSIAYSLELLDGTICSQTSGNKAKSFRVGKREVIKGLDIAMEGKREGDEFEIIVPYNLAYGVTGDRGCVPPMTPIIYRVKILAKYEK